MEETLTRYLGVFAPFVATLVCAHYILRTNASVQVAPAELASRFGLRRTLIASAVAFALIVACDAVTGGDLFLHPRFPESQLLITLLLVTVLLAFTVGRTLAPLARRLKRVA